MEGMHRLDLPAMEVDIMKVIVTGGTGLIGRALAASGPFNLVAPGPLTNARFSQALGRVVRRPALISTPAFGLRLLFGELATALLEGQRALPRRLLELGFAFRFNQVEPALRDLLGGDASTASSAISTAWAAGLS